jgi:CheY-like chemotaxis protein
MQTTNPVSSDARAGNDAPPRAVPKVVIVNGNAATLLELDALFEAPRYDVVFVDSEGLAYTQIKHDRPNLIVLCAPIGDLDAFRVLSLLKLDEETRHIPIVTHTPYDPEDDESNIAEYAANRGAGQRRAIRMN